MARSGLGRASANARLSKQRRAGETAEQREIRLKRERERAKERRAKETAQQKENRKADMRKRRRQKSLQVAYKKRAQRLIDVLGSQSRLSSGNKAKSKVRTKVKRDGELELNNEQNEVYINDYCEQMMIEGELSNEIYLTDNTKVENIEQIKSDVQTAAGGKNKGELKEVVEENHLNEIDPIDDKSIEKNLEEKVKNNVKSKGKEE